MKGLGLAVVLILLSLLLGNLLSMTSQETFLDSRSEGPVLLNPFNTTVTISGNEAPVILSHFPGNLSFSADGNQSFYFNITYEDPDLNAVNAYWYIEDNLVKQTLGGNFSELDYFFPCDLSGVREVKAEVSDGVLNDSVLWDIDILNVACGNITQNNSNNNNGNTPSGGGNFSFTLSRDLILIQTFRGASFRESVIVNNTGENALGFGVSVEGVNDIAVLPVSSFFLSQGLQRFVDVDFNIPSDEDLGIRTGRIVFNANGVVEDVDLIVEILDPDRQALFDLKSELKDVTLTRQQNIDSDIKLTDIAEVGSVGVFMQYFVKDFEDNEFPIGEENLGVIGMLEIERSFEVPDELELGEHLFYVKLDYDGNTVTSSNRFKVISVSVFLWLLIVFLVLTILLVLFLIYREEGVKK